MCIFSHLLLLQCLLNLQQNALFITHCLHVITLYSCFHASVVLSLMSCSTYNCFTYILCHIFFISSNSKEHQFLWNSLLVSNSELSSFHYTIVWDLLKITNSKRKQNSKEFLDDLRWKCFSLMQCKLFGIDIQSNLECRFWILAVLKFYSSCSWCELIFISFFMFLSSSFI